MSGDSMLMCLIAFVLGYLVARMTSGNGLSVGCPNNVRHVHSDDSQRQAIYNSHGVWSGSGPRPQWMLDGSGKANAADPEELYMMGLEDR